MNRNFLSRKCIIGVFSIVFLIGIVIRVFPVFANDPLIAPKMVRVKSDISETMIYTLPNENGQETGIYAKSNEVYELYGIYKTGYCGIYYTDNDGNRKTGYCKATDFKKCVSKLGIDISHHNENIDWDKVAAYNNNGNTINYAMIKVGQTSKSASKVAFMDSMFESYINDALSHNIEAGIYFYSKAKTKEQAQAEAEWVIDKIKTYNITMPVAFDYEDDCLNSLSNSTKTDICKAFTDTINAAGYTGVIYSYQYFFKDNLTFSDIETDYRIWAARYSDTKPDFKNCDMWQFTESGTVDGIKGMVDMNWYYK